MSQLSDGWMVQLLVAGLAALAGVLTGGILIPLVVRVGARLRTWMIGTD